MISLIVLILGIIVVILILGILSEFLNFLDTIIINIASQLYKAGKSIGVSIKNIIKGDKNE